MCFLFHRFIKLIQSSIFNIFLISFFIFEFYKKSQVCTYTTSSISLQRLSGKILPSNFSPVRKNFQVDQVSALPFNSRTFQIPCPGRSLVFYMYFPSFPCLTVVLRSDRQLMTNPRVTSDSKASSTLEKYFPYVSIMQTIEPMNRNRARNRVIGISIDRRGTL